MFSYAICRFRSYDIVCQLRGLDYPGLEIEKKGLNIIQMVYKFAVHAVCERGYGLSREPPDTLHILNSLEINYRVVFEIAV